MTIQELVHELKKITNQQTVEDTHKPTNNERNNVVYLCFKYTIGMPPRTCDYELVETMAPDIKDLPDLKSRYVSTIAEYLWDHFMGEPSTPTKEEIEQVCVAIIDFLYSLTEEERNDLGK